MPSEAIGHSGGGNIICSRRRRDQCAAPHDHHRRIEQSVPPAAAAQLQLPADPRPQQYNATSVGFCRYLSPGCDLSTYVESYEVLRSWVKCFNIFLEKNLVK